VRNLLTIIVVNFAEVLQKITAHTRHIDRVTQITRCELTAILDYFFAIETLRDARIVLRQPLVKRFLGTPNRRHTRPQGVIKVEGDYANLV
jgi:hypothetical protein